MNPFDASLLLAAETFANSVPAGMIDSPANTALTVVVPTTTPTAQLMMLAGEYNPKMIERLLRQKNGPFIAAPAGEEAFLKWLERP